MSVAPATGRAKLIVEYFIIHATYLSVGCSDCSQVHRCSQVVCQGVCGHIGEDTIILVTDSGLDACGYRGLSGQSQHLYLIHFSLEICHIFLEILRTFTEIFLRVLRSEYSFSDGGTFLS